MSTEGTGSTAGIWWITRLVSSRLMLVGVQVLGRRSMEKDIEHAGLLAASKLENGLNQPRRHDQDQEDGDHGKSGQSGSSARHGT